jgi:uncharacterized lipoprotein YddW (UPF0748 family)
MKYTMSLTLCLLALSGVPQATLPPFPREFRAAWVATVDNIDWPSKRGIPTDQAQSELLAILDKARDMHLNAVIFQVRPSADALYESKIEPWSEYLTGEQGRAPSPFWDPLRFAVDEAHKRGLELHCWFNPYRAMHPAQKGPNAPRHVSRQRPSIVRQYGKYLWMDPGEKETQKQSLDVMLDVVRRYDIDGVHIDDYFYPYREKDSAGNYIDFPDTPSWQRYVATGGRMSRSDWRRNNVDTFIADLYKGIKREKAWVKFGISPFGIYRPGIPEGIKAGVDQFADLYADARRWLVEGWCDYYTPQLYWKIEQTPQAYPTLLNWWVRQNPKGRNVWPGLFTSQVMTSANWPASEIVNQIETTRRTPGATGTVHFSMKALMQNQKGLADTLRNGLYRHQALVPASPWLDSSPPPAPTLTQRVPGVFDVAPGDRSEPLRFWAVWARYGDEWQFETRSAGSSTIEVMPGRNDKKLAQVAVAAVDRVGNLSTPVLWTAAQK